MCNLLSFSLKFFRVIEANIYRVSQHKVVCSFSKYTSQSNTYSKTSGSGKSKIKQKHLKNIARCEKQVEGIFENKVEIIEI